jgi:hypothetical protein
MPRYFIGRHVADHVLTQADARTFPDLVKTLLGLPVRLAVTHDEFWRMPKAEQAKTKMVPYLTACTFPNSPHEGRKVELAEACNLIFLDIDDSPETRSTALLFLSSPGTLADRLDGLNFAAYRTASSTPEKPRLRVMVDADGIPPTRYADAVRTIAARLGLAHVTSESVLPTQPMFRPSVFSDTPDTDHPMIATSFDGRPFTVEDIRASDLPALVRQGNTVTPSSTGDLLDDLANSSAPMSGIDEAEARKMLTHLSPDCSRPDWIKVGTALHHQFGDAGEDIWIEWSRGSASKFAGEEDCHTNWKVFRETPAGRSPVTLRTVARKAKEQGYELPAQTEEKADDYSTIEAWINFGCGNPIELMDTAVPRIAKCRLPNTQEQALVQMLSINLRERFDTPVTVTVLKEELKKQKALLANPPGKEQEHVEPPPWARLFVYVTTTREFYQHTTGTKLVADALDAAYSRRLLPTAADLQAADKPVTQATLHAPLYRPQDFLLNHVQIPIVEDYCYEPAQPEFTIVTFGGRAMANTYRRPSHPKAEARFFEAWAVIDMHFRKLFREPESRQTMMDWLAFHVQFPGVKINWAPLLQGGEGSGKSVCTDIAAAILGDDNVNIIAKSAMDKGYNSWVMSSQVVAVEEVRISGANRHEIMDALKPLISNEKVPVVQRYRDERKARHCSNFLLYTNHFDALPVNQNTRRFWYVCSALQSKADILAITDEDPEYFTRLFGMCRDNASGLRAVFENHRISPSFNPKGHAPVTRYLLELAYNTANETTATLRRIIEDDDHPLIAHDALTSDSLRAALKAEGETHASAQHIANVLQEAGYRRMPGRQMIGGKRQFIWFREDCDQPLEFLQKRLDNKASVGEIL